MVIKVSIEVSGASTSFVADVWAESVVGAINLADAHYSGCEVRLVFPIDPDAFFQERAELTMIVPGRAPRVPAPAEDEGEVALATPLA